MCLRFSSLVKNWATVYRNWSGLARNFLVMMTSSTTSITISNPHNPVKEDGRFPENADTTGHSCNFGFCPWDFPRDFIHLSTPLDIPNNVPVTAPERCVMMPTVVVIPVRSPVRQCHPLRGWPESDRLPLETDNIVLAGLRVKTTIQKKIALHLLWFAILECVTTSPLALKHSG